MIVYSQILEQHKDILLVNLKNILSKSVFYLNSDPYFVSKQHSATFKLALAQHVGWYYRMTFTDQTIIQDLILLKSLSYRVRDQQLLFSH